MCELRHIKLSSVGTAVEARAEGCRVSEEAKSVHFSNAKISSEIKILSGLESQDTPLQCSSSVHHNVLIQMPWDTNNFYEWLGDWVTLWETLAALQWEPKDVELYLIGDIKGGKDSSKFARPFDEAWERVFKEKGVRVGSYQQLFGSGTCFDRAVIAPYGGLSTFTFNGGRAGSVNCPSPTVMASALYLEALFSPLPTIPHSSKQVTILLRRGNRAWENDNKAEEAVRNILPSGWDVTTYRPEEKATLGEQLAVAANTQVLVSVHGAGLAHLMFLPPKARVVEIFCGDRADDNRHFANLETMSDDASSAAPESFHLEAKGEVFSTCKMPAHLVKQAIEEYDSQVGTM
jgi:hypothetical protein